MKGIMIGIVSMEGVVEPCVAFKVDDGQPVALSAPAAMNIYNQLGEVLYQLGMFPEEPETPEGVMIQ